MARPALAACSIHPSASSALSLRSAVGVSYLCLSTTRRLETGVGSLVTRSDLIPRAHPDSLARQARASGRFPGTGLPWVLSRLRATTAGRVLLRLERDGRRPPGGGLLDGLEPEDLGTRWVGDLPPGHTGMRGHWAATAASCYDAIAPGASYGGTTEARPRTHVRRLKRPHLWR